MLGVKQSTYLRRVLNALHCEGWSLRVRNEDTGELDPIVSVSGAIKAAKDLDECQIFVTRNEERGWLFIVWQGPDATYPNGAEVISDYTVNLESVIHPIWQEAEGR